MLNQRSTVPAGITQVSDRPVHEINIDQIIDCLLSQTLPQLIVDATMRGDAAKLETRMFTLVRGYMIDSGDKYARQIAGFAARYRKYQRELKAAKKKSKSKIKRKIEKYVSFFCDILKKELDNMECILQAEAVATPRQIPFFRRVHTEMRSWPLSSFVMFRIVYYLKLHLPINLHDMVLSKFPLVQKYDHMRWIEAKYNRIVDPNYKDLWNLSDIYKTDNY